ncbi:MAG: EAL domain-containing protein [Alphaproteobacteria bacterium]|nr:EAL domain-containing protein [Alphaproteobacteria bacterium]
MLSGPAAAAVGLLNPQSAVAWACVLAGGTILHLLVNRLRDDQDGPIGLDHLPDMVFVLDGEGCLDSWNKAAGEMTGFFSSWKGEPIVDAIPNADRAMFSRSLAAMLAGHATRFECRLRSADGTTRPCLFDGAPRRGANGAVRHVVLSVVDITALYDTRRTLEDEERRFRYMVEMAPHLIAVVAGDDIDYINAAGARMLGHQDPAALLGASWKALRTTRDGNQCDHLRRRDGVLVDVDISSVPILMAGRTGTLVEARDVTEINRANMALRESQQRLQGIMNTVADALITCDGNGQVQSFNSAAERLFGIAAMEAMGQPIGMLIEENVPDQRVPTGIERVREATGRRRDGSVFPIELASGELRLEDQSLNILAVRDLTDRKRAERRLLVAEKVLESTSEGVMVTDPGGTILWVNTAFCTISGYARDEVLGQNAGMLKSGFQDAAFYAAMWRQIERGGFWAGEIWNRRKTGEVFPEWLSIKAVYDGGKITRYVGIFSDISKHKRAEETIRHLTYYDAVTRLPNRYLFQDRVAQSVDRAARRSRIVALVLVSLDRFKTVNETLGHQVGDALLREVAARITSAVRNDDTVARMRGDTFCCVLSDLEQTNDANPIIARLLDCFTSSFVLSGHELFVTSSIGISVFPHDGASVDDLLQKAETAMNRSKDKAENTYHFYTPEMNANTIEQLRLETDLRKAIGRNDFVLYYQPKVETDTGRVVGAEALIRWMHPEMGMVPPGRFIPIAEDTGLIIPIGEWALRNACEQIRHWQRSGLVPVPIAVNLSAHQFRQPDLVEMVVRVLEETGVAPSLLELELTESAVMQNAELTVTTLMRLHEHGIGLSIDDFGTGYSSLSYLKRFPIDKLKIDRSFVQDLGTNAAGEEIVTAIVAMARSLNLRVVAEGVETEVQLRLLRQLKCEEVQGYYFSRPVPAERFEEVLKAGIVQGREAA